METTTRVGRNDPCPCGSGKKHKNCCAQRVEVVTEVRRSSGMLVGAIVIGVALAGVIAAQYMGKDEPAPPPATATTIVPVTAPPVPITPGATAGFTPQPPGPVPPGKVWSTEHGHWHDAPGASAPIPVAMGASGPPSPAPAPESQPFAPGTPQPDGPAPAGKVWSSEHGHWHDAPGTNSANAPVPVVMGADGQMTPIPAPDAHPTSPGTPQPPGPPPAGKVWSTEHGHWHDAPTGAPVPQ